MNREEVLNAVAEMSVLELSELIKDMEEKFGVSHQRQSLSQHPLRAVLVETLRVEKRSPNLMLC